VVSLVGATPVGVQPHLDLTIHDRRCLEAELPGLAARRWIVIHPGATDPRRRWPRTAFGEVGAAVAWRGVADVPVQAVLDDADELLDRASA
jgi:ADP-heptose:LPS heptosyltransferase